MRPFLFFAAVVGGALSAPKMLPAMDLQSGPARVALIELYTSEGCSSCPPADRWLSDLRDAPHLGRTFVPVAYHVDYWNRLGWLDLFSNRENTQRQYDYAAAWGTSSVYTPCFIRNGAEWRGAHTLSADVQTAGILSAHYEGETLTASFSPTTRNRGDYEIHAALLGNGILSRVTAGENRGETLRHEFVALQLVHGEVGKSLKLPRTTSHQVSRYALAVWVTAKGHYVPLQSAGGWLP
jgi:hypothetical protein